MEKSVLVEIESKSWMGDRELTPYRLKTRGSYSYDQEGFELKCLQDLKGGSPLIFQSYRDDGIVLRRDGVNDFAIFKIGEHSTTQLPQPLGRMSLKMLTTGIRQDFNEEGGELELRYSYSLPHQDAVTTHMTVKAHPKKERDN